MLRLLRYLPIIIPLVRRLARSPQGKSAIARAKAAVSRKGSGNGTGKGSGKYPRR